MYVIKLLSAAIFATAAFAMDLHRQKVANVWIMAGWIWGWCLQYAAREWDGVLQFFAGSSIPIVCLFPYAWSGGYQAAVRFGRAFGRDRKSVV